MWVFGNLLKRGTQKNEQVWGKIISLGSDNLSLRRLKGTSRWYPKGQYEGW